VEATAITNIFTIVMVIIINSNNSNNNIYCHYY
jgi:hypothetical protein